MYMIYDDRYSLNYFQFGQQGSYPPNAQPHSGYNGGAPPPDNRYPPSASSSYNTQGSGSSSNTGFNPYPPPGGNSGVIMSSTKIEGRKWRTKVINRSPK